MFAQIEAVAGYNLVWNGVSIWGSGLKYGRENGGEYSPDGAGDGGETESSLLIGQLYPNAASQSKHVLEMQW